MLKKIIYFVFLVSVFVSAQNDINNRFMLATSYEHAGEFEKAKDILEDLYLKQPGNFQFFDALNRVYLQLKKYDSSEKIIKDRISVTPQDFNLYGLLGKTYHLKGDEQKAFETWNNAIESSEYNLNVYRLIANYAVERREFNKAIEILNEAKNRSPDKFSFSYDLANLYSLTMNYTGAAEEYILILKSEANNFQNVRSRMDAYINKPEALTQTIKVFEKEKNSSPEIKSTLAWLYTSSKNFESAYDLYKELDDERGSNGVDVYNFAQLLYSMKEYKLASQVYSDIINEYSSSPLVDAAKLGYAKSVEDILYAESYNESGKWKPINLKTEIKSTEADKLIEIYLSLSGKHGNQDLANEASFRAAMIYLNYRNQPGEAEEILKRIIEYPVSLFAAPAALELGLINIKKGQLDEAVEFLTKTANFPRTTDEYKNKAKLLSAHINFYKKDFAAAQELLSQIMTNLKDNSANDAIELSLLLNTKMNDSLSLVIFSEAEYLIAQEKFQEAINKLSSIEEKGGFVLGSLARLRESEVELALNNTEKAVAILEEISDEKSRNIYSDKALYLLGNIYDYSLGNPQKAVEIYEKLLARFPASMYLDDAREHIIILRKKLS